MLATNGKGRRLSDFLYLTKVQMGYELWAEMRKHSSQMNHLADLPEAAAEVYGIDPSRVSAGALARARHMSTFNQWIERGMKPWMMTTPSDGDALLAAAIAAGGMHFGGLTGGVVEGLIGGTIGVPFGVRTMFQFGSNDGLNKEDSDLLNEAHRFSFSEREHAQMHLTELFDSQHLGPTLRASRGANKVTNTIVSAAFNNLDPRDFALFFKKIQRVSGVKGELEMSALIEYMQQLEHSAREAADKKGTTFEFTAETAHQFVDAYLASQLTDTRFTERERAIIVGALNEAGWLDVRGEYSVGDFLGGTHDWLALVSGITPNKFAPLQGIHVRDNVFTVNTLAVGGSHAVALVQTTVVREG